MKRYPIWAYSDAEQRDWAAAHADPDDDRWHVEHRTEEQEMCDERQDAEERMWDW